MADDAKKPTDSEALAEVLRNAQLSIEGALSHLRESGLLSTVDLRGISRRALEDNNSSCNTACSCGQPPRQVEPLQR